MTVTAYAHRHGTAPKSLPSEVTHGHARLDARHNSHLGGPNTLTLYGTPDKPQLYADSRDQFSGTSVCPHRDDLVRFAREVLTFLGEGYSVTLPPWEPASNGDGRRHWFLCRRDVLADQSIPLADRYRFDGRGILIRYASMENAQRAAGRLNAAEQETRADDSTRALDAIAGILSSRFPSSGWSEAMDQRQAVISVLRSTGRMQEASS